MSRMGSEFIRQNETDDLCPGCGEPTLPRGETCLECGGGIGSKIICTAHCPVCNAIYEYSQVYKPATCGKARCQSELYTFPEKYLGVDNAED